MVVEDFRVRKNNLAPRPGKGGVDFRRKVGEGEKLKPLK